MRTEWLIFWLVGVCLMAAWLGRAFLSRSSRVERRRRKSHHRLISKASRPSVRFSVRAPRKK